VILHKAPRDGHRIVAWIASKVDVSRQVAAYNGFRRKEQIAVAAVAALNTVVLTAQ